MENQNFENLSGLSRLGYGLLFLLLNCLIVVVPFFLPVILLLIYVIILPIVIYIATIYILKHENLRKHFHVCYAFFVGSFTFTIHLFIVAFILNVYIPDSRFRVANWTIFSRVFHVSFTRHI